MCFKVNNLSYYLHYYYYITDKCQTDCSLSLSPSDLQGTAQHTYCVGRHGDVVVTQHGLRGRRPLGDPARLHEVQEGENPGGQ